MSGKLRVKAKNRRIEVVGKNGYCLNFELYSRVTTEELCSHIAHDANLPLGSVRAGFAAIVTQIEQMMLNGHSIEIQDVGTLRLSWSAKAVSTEEQVGVDQLRRLRVLYSPTQDIKTAFNTTPVDIEIVE